MKHRSWPLAIVTLVSTCAAQAGAQVGSWYVAPQFVGVNPDSSYNAEDAQGGSLALGKVLSEKWDAELSFIETRHDVAGGGDKLKMNGPSLNLNRVFRRDEIVTPFLGIGLNSISYRDPDTGSTERKLGAAIKAGVLGDITRDGAWQISAEIGERIVNFSSELDDTFYGLGLRFNFGGAPKVAAAPVAPAATPAPAPAPVAPPPVDSDGDGVVDSVDRCPNTPAGAKVDARGCELDGDRDGVVDRLDKCPTTPAGDKVDAVGCSLNIVLQVQFDTNSATIKSVSYPELDNFVKFFTDVPSAKGVLEGHTDNVGNDAYNLKLSQRRAAAVKAYVVAKGIDAARIDAKGYGETRPVADNNTAEGRASNRRVLFVRSDVEH